MPRHEFDALVEIVPKWGQLHRLWGWLQLRQHCLVHFVVRHDARLNLPRPACGDYEVPPVVANRPPILSRGPFLHDLIHTGGLNVPISCYHHVALALRCCKGHAMFHHVVHAHLFEARSFCLGVAWNCMRLLAHYGVRVCHQEKVAAASVPHDRLIQTCTRVCTLVLSTLSCRSLV